MTPLPWAPRVAPQLAADWMLMINFDGLGVASAVVFCYWLTKIISHFQIFHWQQQHWQQPLVYHGGRPRLLTAFERAEGLARSDQYQLWSFVQSAATCYCRPCRDSTTAAVEIHGGSF